MSNLTKEEYIARQDMIHNPIIEKYGLIIHYLLADVFNISAMEKICENLGYTTVRVKYEMDKFSFYSQLYFGKKLIGTISNQGLPSIELYKRNKKHAAIISKDDKFITPIKGIHRVLDWHEVQGKYHILANNEIVLHFLPVVIDEEMITEFLNKTGLSKDVKHLKSLDKMK